MESAISIFRKLPETKGQVSKYSRLIRESVLNGEIDPLIFISQVSALELLFKGLKSDSLIKDLVLVEAEKYGKSFEKENAKFQVKEMGVTYDFSECSDAELDSLNQVIKDLTEKKKARENFLKAIQPDKEVYDENGIQLFAPVKKSTTGVAIILK